MYKEQTEENRGPWYTRRIPKRDDETGRKDIDIARRMTRFQLRPPRLRNVENPISRSNGRKLSRENEGKIGRKTKQDRGNRKLCSSIIGVPRSCTVNQGLLLRCRKFGGRWRERREGGRETTLVNPARTFCSIGKLNVVPGALYFVVLLHLTDY